MPKKWCFWTVVLEKTPESPLDWKEIKPVNPKGNQPWIYIGRTDVEAEAPTLWPTDAKDQLIGKDPNAEKDWGQEEKGVAEDEMAGWDHWLNGHEFEWTLEDSEGQRSLACCYPWGHRVGHDLANEQSWLNENCHEMKLYFMKIYEMRCILQIKYILKVFLIS